MSHSFQPGILHVSQPVTEGVAVVVADAIRHQTANGYRVGLACPPDSELARAGAGAGAHVFCWPARRTPGPRSAVEAAHLARTVARFRPGLVHLHSAKAGLAGRLAVAGRTPTIYQPHGWSFLSLDGPSRRAAREWERFSLRWTDAVVAVSREEAALAVELGASPALVEVITNGVDTDYHHPPDRGERAAARRALGLNAEPTVVCIGRLAPQKGQDLLLEAWRRVERAVPDARLLLVGDGPSRAALEQVAPTSVSLLGTRDDTRAILQAADVVAMPSRWEGMSLAMLEAMASGVAVIATGVGGVAETIGRGAGAVVPFAPEPLADALIARLTDPARSHREGARGRRLVVERHQRHQAQSALLWLYHRLLVPPVLATPSVTIRLAAGPPAARPTPLEPLRSRGGA